MIANEEHIGMDIHEINDNALIASNMFFLIISIIKDNITDSIGFPYEWADYQPAKVYYLAPKNLEKNVTQLHKD